MKNSRSRALQTTTGLRPIVSDLKRSAKLLPRDSARSGISHRLRTTRRSFDIAGRDLPLASSPRFRWRSYARRAAVVVGSNRFFSRTRSWAGVASRHKAKRAAASRLETYGRWKYRRMKKRPNQPPEPTALLVTPRADARVAPSNAVAVMRTL